MDFGRELPNDLTDDAVSEIDLPERWVVSATAKFEEVSELATARWEALRGTASLPSGALDPSEEPRLYSPRALQIAWIKGIETPEVVHLGSEIATEFAITEKGGYLNENGDTLGHLLARLSQRAAVRQKPLEFSEMIADGLGYKKSYRGLILPFAGTDPDVFLVTAIVDWDAPEPFEGTSENMTEANNVLILDHEFDPSEMPRLARNVPPPPFIFVSLDKRKRPKSSGAGHPEAPLLLADEWESLTDGTTPYDAHLAQSLNVARQRVAVAAHSDERSHAALYGAISAAYDFALRAAETPEEYERMLHGSSLKQQPRAPMTPIVKLVFGAHYDRTRLAEFAAALSHAVRIGVPARHFGDYLKSFEGGLKALIKAERQLRRAGEPPRPSRLASLEARLRKEQVHPFSNLEAGGEEFVLVLARRLPDGQVAMLGKVPQDEQLISRAASAFLAQ